MEPLISDFSETRNGQIVSIDAWREPEGGWSWNDVRNVGTIDAAELTVITHSPKAKGVTRKILKWFRDNGFTNDCSKGRLTVQFSGGDPNIIEVVDKNTYEPLYAIMVGYD